MREHAEVGGKFVTVTNHTTYSFGIDDQEFMPAFECEEPADFMHLMMTLRETEASRWTERDTPIFVGTLVDVRVGARRAGRRRHRAPEPDDALHRARRLAVPRARTLTRTVSDLVSRTRALRRASTRRRRRTGRTG